MENAAWQITDQYPVLLDICILVYSYFEKRCLKKAQNCTSQLRKVVLGRRIEPLHVLNTNEI